MAIFSTVKTEVSAIVSLIILVVIGSVILVKFKNVDGVTAAINTTIDTSVTGLQEPASWVTIAIVALVGIAIYKYYSGSKKGGM